MEESIADQVYAKTYMSLSAYAHRYGLRLSSLYRGIVNVKAAEQFKRDGIAIEATVRIAKRHRNGV